MSNMAKEWGAQDPHIEVVFGDLTNGTDLVKEITVPDGYRPEQMQLVVPVVFNTGGTCTIKVGDNDDDDRYLTSLTVKTATVAKNSHIIGDFTTAAFQAPAGNKIVVTVVPAANATAATTGELQFMVKLWKPEADAYIYVAP